MIRETTLFHYPILRAFSSNWFLCLFTCFIQLILNFSIFLFWTILLDHTLLLAVRLCDSVNWSISAILLFVILLYSIIGYLLVVDPAFEYINCLCDCLLLSTSITRTVRQTTQFCLAWLTNFQSYLICLHHTWMDWHLRYYNDRIVF